MFKSAPWTRQPPQFTPIADEFREGLIASFNGSMLPEFHRYSTLARTVLRVGHGSTAASGNTDTPSGQVYTVSSTGPQVVRINSTSVDGDVIVEVPASSWTFQCRVESIGSSGTNGGFFRTASEAGTTFVIQNGSTRRPWVRVNSSDILQPGSGAQWVTGQTLDLVIRFVNATKVEAWWDGKLQHSATHAVSQNAQVAGDAIPTFGRQASGEYTTGRWSAIRFWGRALNDSQVERLARNPWAFYEPQRRPYAPALMHVVGGGGGGAKPWYYYQQMRRAA